MLGKHTLKDEQRVTTETGHKLCRKKPSNPYRYPKDTPRPEDCPQRNSVLQNPSHQRRLGRWWSGESTCFATLRP